MRKIFQYILIAIAVVVTASCSNELDEALQPVNKGSLQFVVGDFPAFGEGTQTRAIGTQDEGKTAWENGDEIIVTLISQKYGEQAVALTYNGSSWSTEASLSYLENETPSVSVFYAPCYEVTEEGTMQLRSGMQLGMTEYLSGNYEMENGIMTITFEGAIRTYSRLRLAGLANQTLTVTTTDFTPAGATEVATAAYTLTTNDNGNAFLYGTFAVEATVSVTQGDIEIGTHAFASATEECVSYALDAMSPYIYDEATNTYTVYTAKGLLDWSEAARADLTTNLVLAADITLTGENNWTPVGAYESVSDEDNTEYIGTINGGGHTITGLHINNNSDVQGFISALGEGGTVKNLTFADVHMTAGQYSGIVAGKSKGTVENCHVTSGVNSYIHGSQCVGGIVGYNVGSVTGCTNNGTVSGSGSYVGGIVGQGTVDAVITNCTNSGTVSGEDQYVGGIVGENLGSVTNCTNTAAVSGDVRVGGVAGLQASAPITNCTNSGTVSGTDYYVGGIAGGISHSVTAIGCYNTADVTGGSYVGGIAGIMGKDGGATTITNCYNTAAITGEHHVAGIAYCNGDDRTITNCYNTGTISATDTNAEYGVGVAYTNGGATVTNCYYLNTAASGGINGADVEGQVEAKTAAEFASADMAVLLNGDQTDAPWEYIEGNAAPTLKFFNKNKN